MILILSATIVAMLHQRYFTRMRQTKMQVKFIGFSKNEITDQLERASWISCREPTSSQSWSGPTPVSPRNLTALVKLPSKKCFRWRAMRLSWQLSMVFKDTELDAPSSARLIDVTTGSTFTGVILDHQVLMREVGNLKALALWMVSTQLSPLLSNMTRGMVVS